MSDTLKIYGVTHSGVTSLNANDLNHVNKQYVRPEGTKSITAMKGLVSNHSVKKVSGSWVTVDIANAFQSGVNYKRG